MKTTLKKDERLVLITKPHWITLFVPFFVLVAALIVGLLIGGYGLLVILAAGIYLAYKIVERSRNIWAVTNLRVIDEFGVFSNNSKESPLDKINNVSYRQSLWGKMFGFGNVQIQTAAEIGSTTYTMVAGPKDLKDSITRMQEAYKYDQIKRQAEEMAGVIAANQLKSNLDVPAELEKLFDLKQRGILTEDEFNTRKTKLLST
jgi:uncharacterized membrane protein YdbT with pleckstrin-like domain